MTSRLLFDVPAVLTPSHRLQPDVIVVPNMVQAQWNSTSASTDGCRALLKSLCTALEMQKAGLVREDLDLDWTPFQVLFLHFGPLLLGPAIERALSVDSYAADIIRRRCHAAMELLGRGIFNEPKDAR